MKLSDEFLERIKQANDIVAMMSQHTELKPRGRDYVCLCPFHSEKTASCYVYTDDPHFHCYGCGAGGDVINFVRLSQNLEFMDAVRFLAERSGIAMPDDDGNGEEELRKRKRIEQMNLEAAKFFVKNLNSYASSAGVGSTAEISPGLVYFRNRGLSDNTIRKYGLGYAPDSWNSLKYHMNGLGYNDLELVEASLLKQNEKGNIYDMFRNRAMFPVIDRYGRVIAFSGRQIADDGFGGKYVNSSNTLVFKKGNNIFSINFAKNTDKDYFILCEGQMDAVILNQAGFNNAVAGLGTAFTAEQARLMRSFVKDIVIAYDSDAAGDKAAAALINTLDKEGMSAKNVSLQNANDPDDYIKQFGADSFAIVVKEAISAIEFKMNKLKEPLDLESPQGRAEYLKRGVDYLSVIDSSTNRMLYGSDLAKDCGVVAAEVLKSIESKRKSAESSEKKKQERELKQTGSISTNAGVKIEKLSKEEKAESGIIAFLFHSPDKLGIILSRLSPDDFLTEFHRKLLETLIIRLHKGLSIGRESLGDEFSAHEMGRIERIKQENADFPFTDERLGDYINVLLELKKVKNKKSFDEMNEEEALEEYNKIQKEKIKVG